MHTTLNEMRRRMVLDTNGRVVGRVKAAFVDMDTWLVDTLRVTVARAASADLEMPWAFWRRPVLDVPTGLIHGAGDAIILRVSLAELRESPPASIGEPGEHAASIH